MSQPARQAKPHYTWADYCTWPDDERWEIIDGEAYSMSPSPAERHQWIASNLMLQVGLHFRGKPCRVYTAPFDLKLSADDVVQPDLMVVCDRRHIKSGHIAGAPSLVVEILSPGSTLHDRVRKLRLYARAGIKEYWLITPYPSTIEVLQLDGADYRIHDVFTPSQASPFASPSFPGLTLDLHELFDFEVPPEERVQEVRASESPYGPSPRPAAAT